MKIKKQKAFTLVELIVVITILAILGTIAFISLQGYSQNSRDSVRISDISNMKTSLELFHLEAGKYPNPTEGVDITLSGAIVWNQGTFGETVKANVDKLDKIPTDPSTDTKYTYSTTATRNKFQIGGILEGEPLSFNYFENTNAAETEGTALVSGTYNGQTAKALSGTTCNMVSIPSIITNDVTTTDLQQIINSGSLVYNGFKNLPSTFKTSKFKHDGGFAFIPNNLIAYTDNSSCTPLTDGSNYLPRVQLLKGIQDSYSGTVLASESDIARIISLPINVLTPSEEVKNLAGTYVNNNFGGSVKIVVQAPVYASCTSGTMSGYTFGNLLHNQSENVTKSESISNGTKNYGAQAVCTDGVASVQSEIYNIVCTSGYVEQAGACVQDICINSVPTNAHSTATSQSAAVAWIHNASTPGVCTFACDLHYTWNGSNACVADTQSANCTGLPAHAVWNTASSITQTWNSTVWNPVDTGDYNLTPSTTTCNYKCDLHYTWDGDSCEADTQSVSCGGSIPSNATATTATTYNQTWDGNAWAPTVSWSENFPSACDFNCDANYNWNGTSCVLNTCTFGTSTFGNCNF